MRKKIDRKLAIQDSQERSLRPVVMIHGFPFDSEMWRPIAQKLRGIARCVAYDLPGFGASPNDTMMRTIDSHADDLIDLIDQYRLRAPIICGHDVGAMIAMRAMERIPERISGIALCNVLPYAPSRQELDNVNRLLRVIRDKGSKGFTRRYFPTIFSQVSRLADGSSYKRLASAVAKNDPIALHSGLLWSITRGDAMEAMEGFRNPSLLIGGQHDDITPASEMLHVSLSLNRAVMRRIPDTGHATPLEHPDAVVDALLAFIRSLDAKDGDRSEDTYGIW